MQISKIDILLVEDDRHQVEFIRSLLLHLMSDFEADVKNAGTLAAAQKALAEQVFDVILLDLNLSDSSGLTTYYQIRELQKRTPVVILTASEEKEMALQAIKTGAQDYLYKTALQGGVLLRSILFAIERNRHWTQLMDEMDGLNHIVVQMQASANVDENVFSKFESEYKELLDIVAEQKIYKSKKNYSERLMKMAADLAAINADAGFIIEIHYAAMMEKITGAAPQEYRSSAEEGRLLIVELLGHLSNAYRAGAART